MAPKDKIYLIPTAGNYKSLPWEPPMRLPQKLELKKAIRLNLPSVLIYITGKKLTDYIRYFYVFES